MQIEADRIHLATGIVQGYKDEGLWWGGGDGMTTAKL